MPQTTGRAAAGTAAVRPLTLPFRVRPPKAASHKKQSLHQPISSGRCNDARANGNPFSAKRFPLSELPDYGQQHSGNHDLSSFDPEVKGDQWDGNAGGARGDAKITQHACKYETENQ